MKRIYEAAVIFLGTLGWWGFVYPDLCLTEDVYEQEAQQQEETAEGEASEGEASEESDPENAGMAASKGKSAGITDSAFESSGTDDSGADKAGAEQAFGEGWKLGDLRIKCRIAEYVYQVRGNTAAKDREGQRGAFAVKAAEKG